MGKTKEICGVCDREGIYDHEDELNGNMTLLTHYFDYVHWGCFDKAIEIRDSIGEKKDV